MFVEVNPRRVDDAGLPSEHSVENPDPEQVGLIATPTRLILEPGQRKFLRVAALRPPGDADRIFRVVVKPVSGAVTSTVTGLKLMFGYEMLVIQRPVKLAADLHAERSGDRLLLENRGDTNIELFRGKQCGAGDKVCEALPGERIYAGAKVVVPVKPAAVVTYVVKVGSSVTEKTF